MRSFLFMRLDQYPARLYLSGSGFPVTSKTGDFALVNPEGLTPVIPMNQTSNAKRETSPSSGLNDRYNQKYPHSFSSGMAIH